MDIEKIAGELGLGVAIVLSAALPTVPVEDVCENLGDAICWVMGWDGQADTFAERFDHEEQGTEHNG